MQLHDSVQLGTSLQAELLAFSEICKVTASKFTAKLSLLSHSENYAYIKLTFVVVSHKIFLIRLFCAPCLLRPGATVPSAPTPQLRHCTS